ncbi:hypothetical protein [Cohnella zeiphila]|uniref:Photosynthesis system II assembly factor Ycf48/Hcf136-like domain-containing protein n=1 Tax=Cohnella zeiphila TaxID=2761120 RepID=A0A7X0SLD8_9BACL|nr:hypothetical protein [Cohnella zeiphila]MBB6730964.1 hypothetical protein [Cohnella zeiphila]
MRKSIGFTRTLALAAAMLLGVAAGTAAAETGDAPEPSAAPAPSGPQPLKLNQVQFVDANHGWTVGSNGGQADSTVWRTTDGGRKWKSAALGGGVRNASIGMANEKHGWAVGPAACKDEAGMSVCGQTTVLHTHDGGHSWLAQLTRQDAAANADNEVDPITDHTAFVRVRSSLWRTTDQGKNWTDISLGASEAHPYTISFANDLIGFAAGRIGPDCPEKGQVPASPNAKCQVAVWKTKNGGRSWSRLPHAPKQNGEWYPVDIQFPDTRNGYLLLVNPDTHGSLLYFTSNGGANWRLRNSKIPGIRPYAVKLDFVNPRTGYVPLSVGAGPVDGGLLRTINGGTTFAKLEDRRLVSVEDADFLTPRRGFVVAMNPSDPNARLVLATDDGGGSWKDITPEDS